MISSNTAVYRGEWVYGKPGHLFIFNFHFFEALNIFEVPLFRASYLHHIRGIDSM